MSFNDFLGLNVVSLTIVYFWIVIFRWLFEIIPHK